MRVERHAKEARVDGRAEPAGRIDAANRCRADRKPRTVRMLKDASRHRGLAQESDRRLLIDELESQLDPNRLGHIEI